MCILEFPKKGTVVIQSFLSLKRKVLLKQNALEPESTKTSNNEILTLYALKLVKCKLINSLLF